MSDWRRDKIRDLDYLIDLWRKEEEIWEDGKAAKVAEDMVLLRTQVAQGHWTLSEVVDKIHQLGMGYCSDD